MIPISNPILHDIRAAMRCEAQPSTWLAIGSIRMAMSWERRYGSDQRTRTEPLVMHERYDGISEGFIEISWDFMMVSW
jgi:hypothetical protein